MKMNDGTRAIALNKEGKTVHKNEAKSSDIKFRCGWFDPIHKAVDNFLGINWIEDHVDCYCWFTRTLIGK